MGKKKNSNIEKTAHQLNDEYLMSFASTRGSLGMLRVAWAGMFFSGIESWILWSLVMEKNKNPFTDACLISILIIFIFMFLCVVISYFPNILYKYQRFSAIMYAVFTMILLISVLLTFYILILKGSDNTIDSLYPTNMLSWLFLICIPIVYILSLVYNYYWLKNQLKEGFSESRTLGNYLAKSSVYSSKSLSIIGGISFASIAIGSFITGDFEKIIMLSMSIFLTIVFSRLTIEASYIAYLRFQSKKYWEDYDFDYKEHISPEEKKSRKIHWIKIIYLSLSLIIFIILSDYINNVSKQLNLLIILTMLAILISWLVMFVIWVIKSIKNKLNNK
ncbi:hypothetical protein BG262_05825 [Floricoccus penangensis]|uniref:Uncharacterized protein n=1 Tax=Floricoccus penangensis TaxID=1859475 RepID=A0A9Q5JFJ1_9LACT|nr:hypothetical protein [Floricoccus penangensis]OFI46002.1 hypothetical protein BG262_05825 [Floricoccus penangensis]